MVDGEKVGGQLFVETNGSVAWRTDSINSDLVCHAHAHNVRILAIAGRPKWPGNKHYDPTEYYRALLSNETAVLRAASELAQLATAAGFDGVEFDMESMLPANRSDLFDFATAYAKLLAATRAAMLVAQPHATVYVTMGVNNMSAEVQDHGSHSLSARLTCDGGRSSAAGAALLPGLLPVEARRGDGRDLPHGLRHVAPARRVRRAQRAARLDPGVRRDSEILSPSPAVPIETPGGVPLDSLGGHFDRYVTAYIASGAPAEKLILGMPWYARGHSFTSL